MHTLTRFGATAVALVALAAPALAQSQAPASDAGKPPAQMQDKTAPSPPITGSTTAPTSGALVGEQQPHQSLVDQLVGLTVVNRSGEDIGEIADLVIEDGSITAAVVSVGGFLGIGSKEVGVDWTAVEIDKRDGERIALIDLTRAELDQAPAFKPYRPAAPSGMDTQKTGPSLPKPTN